MGNKTLTKKTESPAIPSLKILWALLGAFPASVILYYAWARGFVYLNFSREVYTDYFWFRAPWLLVHVLAGLTATLAGPVQFIPAIRTRYPVLHRNVGKVYLGSIVVGTATAFYLASTAQLGMVYAVGLTMLGVVWLGSSGMAYASILKRNLPMHKEWMIKSYVLTVAFVSFRFVEDVLTRLDVSTFVDRKVLMAWACWAIPFFVTEVALQCRRLFR